MHIVEVFKHFLKGKWKKHIYQWK